ncbi:MAG: DNA translocase FtsK [Bacteroides sp.]|nr:DNA translocase FtsK [Bacteroides sp.]
MAATQQKKTTKTASSPSKSASGSKKAEALARNKRRRNIWSVVLFAVGLMLIGFAFFGSVDAEEPNMWDYIHGFFCGVFGAAVFLVGPIFIYFAVMISLDKGKTTAASMLIKNLLFILLLCGAIQIIFVGRIAAPETEGFGDIVSEVYNGGTHLSGGGVLSLIVAYPLLLLGRVGATIVIVLIIFVIVMLIADISLMDFLRLVAKPFVKLGAYLKRKREEYAEESRYVQEERELREAERKERELDEEKFRRIDAMTKVMRGEETGSVPENDRQTKAIVNEQRQESDEYLVKIGAKPAVVPPRLTDEDYAKPEAESRTDAAPDTSVTDKTEGADNTAETQTSAAVDEKESDKIEKEETVPEAPTEQSEQTAAENAAPEAESKVEEAPKSEVSEIEQAIIDYNKEIEERSRRNGIVLDSSEGGENVQQPADRLAVSVEEYVLPPVTLLNEIKKTATDENISAEIENNASTLVSTLNSFGVKTIFKGAVRGPSVTRYELQPATGVKISKITGLVDDISLNLATAGIRIEAPIPNKAAVGIEVPNKEKDTVFIREMIDSDTFRKCESKLGAALGKNISGDVIICNIADMPHILIAGTTGAGKSVCVNSIIMSILFRSTPDEVRLVMIDPKAVEFMIYNGIGYLLLPVVTDPKKAAGALAWACTEMDKRYNTLSENNVRDIKAYNKLAASRDDLEPMPQVVIFIDELADLMMCAKNDVEASICRLAQKARAAGMHLVVATQRPSVDVITGLIKSNIPSRIALKVASQVDSRTIIDGAGAEKLLGKGDMLYKSVTMPMPTRVQGCWVSDDEVERVTEFIKNKFALEYDENVMNEIDRQAERVGGDDKNKSDAFNGDLDVSDDKLDEAIDVVFANGGASTSALQRRLNVGYGRAARLVDMMEQMGIVGPQDGNKPRQLLMSKESWYERKLNRQD